MHTASVPRSGTYTRRPCPTSPGEDGGDTETGWRVRRHRPGIHLRPPSSRVHRVRRQDGRLTRPCRRCLRRRRPGEMEAGRARRSSESPYLLTRAVNIAETAAGVSPLSLGDVCTVHECARASSRPHRTERAFSGTVTTLLQSGQHRAPVRSPICRSYHGTCADVTPRVRPHSVRQTELNGTTHTV